MQIGENKARQDLYRLPEDEYLVFHEVIILKTYQIDMFFFTILGNNHKIL